MKKYLEKSGKTEDEALAAALAELGLDRDDVSVEIVARAKSGFLGIGASPAVVRVEYEAPDEPVKSAEPAAESVKSAPRRPKAESAAAPTAKAGPAAPKYAGEGVKADTERFLAGLLERMGITAEIEIRDRENGGLLVELSGPGMGAVIGRRGETLDAIQHLTNYVVNQRQALPHQRGRGELPRQARGEPGASGGENGRQGAQVQALHGAGADELL